MKLSAMLTFWAGLVFAAVCGAFGVRALWSLDAIADATAREDARGFGWFWLFLGAIGLVIALVSARMAKDPRLEGE